MQSKQDDMDNLEERIHKSMQIHIKEIATDITNIEDRVNGYMDNHEQTISNDFVKQAKYDLILNYFKTREWMENKERELYRLQSKCENIATKVDIGKPSEFTLSQFEDTKENKPFSVDRADLKILENTIYESLDDQKFKFDEFLSKYKRKQKELETRISNIESNLSSSKENQSPNHMASNSMKPSNVRPYKGLNVLMPKNPANQVSEYRYDDYELSESEVSAYKQNLEIDCNSDNDSKPESSNAMEGASRIINMFDHHKKSSMISRTSKTAKSTKSTRNQNLYCKNSYQSSKKSHKAKD